MKTLKRMWRRVQKVVWGEQIIRAARRERWSKQSLRRLAHITERIESLPQLARHPLRPAHELVAEFQRAHKCQNENPPKKQGAR